MGTALGVRGVFETRTPGDMPLSDPRQAEFTLSPSPSPGGAGPWAVWFRKFFVRGVAFLLPTVLTIWLIMSVYGFFQYRIAEPINAGIRYLIVQVTPWPEATEEEIIRTGAMLESEQLWVGKGDPRNDPWLDQETRRRKLEIVWSQYAFPLDLIGLLIAVVLTCVVGALVGSFIGHRLVAKCEGFLLKVPFIKQVYPSVKQVTSFLVGSDNPQMRFRKVVAVEYPRKGMWSLGLVTGDTLRTVSEKAGQECVTLFVPNSPTPFTGYVIVVPRKDTIELSMRIEEALRFIVSGGVIVPRSESGQRVDTGDGLLEGAPVNPEASAG